MSSKFDKLVKHDHTKPPRIVILGDDGIGKTTFGASAPNPIIIQTEDGLGGLQVPALPLCENFAAYDSYMDMCVYDDHPYKTVVIDSADWLDILVQKDICEIHNHKSIADFGYGRGYELAAQRWTEILSKINLLRDRGCIPLFTVHAQLGKVENPEHGDYDKYVFKMHKKSRALLQEWADVILFATADYRIKKEDTGFGGKKNRVVGGEKRVMHTQSMPTFTAKNRYSLPPTLPLSWEAFQKAYADSIKKLKGVEDNDNAKH